MPNTTIASALADLDKAVCAQFTNGLHHGISIGRMSAAAMLDYAGHTEAAQLVRALDNGNDLPARKRFAATELAYFNDLNELPAGWAWTPDMLRTEAERLEANP